MKTGVCVRWVEERECGVWGREVFWVEWRGGMDMDIGIRLDVSEKYYNYTTRNILAMLG